MTFDTLTIENLNSWQSLWPYSIRNSCDVLLAMHDAFLLTMPVSDINQNHLHDETMKTDGLTWQRSTGRRRSPLSASWRSAEFAGLLPPGNLPEQQQPWQYDDVGRGWQRHYNRTWRGFPSFLQRMLALSRSSVRHCNTIVLHLYLHFSNETDVTYKNLPAWELF